MDCLSMRVGSGASCSGRGTAYKISTSNQPFPTCIGSCARRCAVYGLRCPRMAVISASAQRGDDSDGSNPGSSRSYAAEGAPGGGVDRLGRAESSRRAGNWRTSRSWQQATSSPLADAIAKRSLVRVDTVRSSIKGAAGALVKLVKAQELSVLVAVDEAGLWRTLLTLTIADRMLRASIGHMLVFQPSRVGAQAMQPPHVPEGAYAFYVSKLLAGDIAADNTLLLGARSEYPAVASAIIARINTAGHTMLEGFGSHAGATALQAVTKARQGLLVKMQDCSVVLASQDVPCDRPGVSSGRVMLNRLVVVECAPRQPAALALSAQFEGHVGDTGGSGHQGPDANQGRRRGGSRRGHGAAKKAQGAQDPGGQHQGVEGPQQEAQMVPPMGLPAELETAVVA